jgi:hypothetical protein
MQFPLRKNKWQSVEFVPMKVANVSELINNVTLPPTRGDNKYDSPFTKLCPLDATECWKNKNFAEQYGTDWFGEGLKSKFKEETKKRHNDQVAREISSTDDASRDVKRSKVAENDSRRTEKDTDSE